MLICYLQLFGQDRLGEPFKETLVVVQLRRVIPTRRRVSPYVIIVIEVTQSMHVCHLFLNYKLSVLFKFMVDKVQRAVERFLCKLIASVADAEFVFINDIIIMKECIMWMLLSLVHSFTFLYPSITVDVLTINKPATYSFFAARNQDIGLNPTPYSSQPVPALSTIVIAFPSQYNLTTTTPKCSSLLINDNPITGFTTSVTGTNITISNAIPTSLAIANVTVSCQNVTNPYPAITTDPFLFIIGQDVSANSTTVTLTPGTFQLCTVTFSPAFVNTTGAMVVSIRPQNQILVNGFIEIQFPSNLQWALDISTSHTLPIASTSCSIVSGQVLAGSCTGLTATATVSFTITSLNSSSLILPFSYQINGLFSPPNTSPSDTLLITSYSSSFDAIDTCVASITGLVPQVLSLALTANTSPLIVSTSTTLVFTFTLTDTIIKSDYFVIIFPSGTTFSLLALSTVNIQIFLSGATYTSSNLTLLMRQSAASSTRFAGALCRISISSYTAPPSVKTTGNFILQIYNNQNYLKMQGTATLTAQANTFTMTVAASSYLINQNAVYTFTITTLNFLTNTSYILITLPSDLAFNVSTNCLTNNFTAPATNTCSTNGSIIRLDSLTTSGIAANTYTLSIQSIINPNRAVSNLSFTANFYYSNDSTTLTANAYFTSLTYVPNLLNINTTQVTLSNYNLLATPISSNVTFTTKDAVPMNGYVLITIPAEINIVSGYSQQCLYTSGATSVSSTCSLTGQVFNVSFGNRVISAGQTVTLSLNNFGTNPKSTRPTSSYQIYIYSPDGFLINYLNTSLTIHTFLPIPFQFVTISPKNFTNYATNAYSFYFQQTASWDVSSSILIQLPTSITPSGNITCIDVNTNTNLTCSIINTTKISVSLATSASTISLTISSLINPPSQRTTSYFIITSYTSDGYIYATDSSINITTNSPSAFNNLTYSFSNPYYNQTTNLTLTIINTAAITTSYLLTNIAQFSTGSISCTSLTSSPSCSVVGQNLVVSTSASFPLANDITILNMFVPMTNVTSMTLRSFDSTYAMSTSSPIAFQTICSLPCYTCLSAASPLVCLSCYPTSIFTNLTYYSNNSCYSSCPAGTFSNNGSLTCSACSSSCAQCTSSDSNCSECTPGSPLPVLYLVNSTCVSTCPSGTYSNNITNTTKYSPVCSACEYPCSTCLTATLCTACSNSSLFYYQNQCVSSCPGNISIANVTSMVCQSCANICLTCINTTLTCLSCNTSVAPIYLAENLTCVSTCPSPLVIDGTVCSPCSSPCNTCSLTKTNCTSCLNGTFLSAIQNGSCLSICDQNYFGNTTTLLCQLCSSITGLNCDNCLNSTNCITCNTGFVFFTPNSSCLALTPQGYTNISGIAVACTSNCSQCSQVTYNCTACTGIYQLYKFAGTGYCQQQCPTTSVAFNNTCVTCTSPCLTCVTTLTNCSSCLTGYLISANSTLTCISSCPNSTFLNITTSLCTSCLSPCFSCLGSSLSCTSCLDNSSYILNYTCVSSCPNNSVIDFVTKTCYPCVSPCLSCSISANNCTSCIAGYYFYQLTNQCLTVCVANVSVADPNGTFTCVSCTDDCFTCSITPNNCLSCSQNYSFYNSTCVLACPSGLYSSANKCLVCTNNCSTCTSSTGCITCLSTSLLYQSQCISTCPVSASIIANNTCIVCSNSCLNCSATDVCYDCPSNTALYLGACVTSCPSPLTIYYNTSSNKLSCFTDSQIATQNLQDTLKVTTVLPLPFTIITTFLFLCCLMSKIQNMDTYIIGVGYSLYGCAEFGSLIVLMYIYSVGYSTTGDYSLYFLLLSITLGIIVFLNLISLTCVTPFLSSDPQFKNWLKQKPRGTPEKDSLKEQSSQDVETTGSDKENDSVECCSHVCTFAWFTIFSTFTSYKLRLLIFTKLFRFNCLTAHLQNIHGFRAFNVLSFFGIVHEGFAVYITIKLMMIFGLNDSKLYFAIIDCLIMTLASFILALLATHKDQDFFKIHNNFKNGVDLGHRKKDKDRLKNLKIDEKRLKGMDSRDKLIDINGDHSELQEEEIIVNHNINGPGRPKKVGSNWVEVDESKKIQSPRSPVTRDSKNIFQIDNDYEEEDYQHMRMTERERAELFHTSVKPSKKHRINQSRAEDWVEVNEESVMQMNNASKYPPKDTLLKSAQPNIGSQQAKTASGQHTPVNIGLNSRHTNVIPKLPVFGAIGILTIKQTDSQQNQSQKQPNRRVSNKVGNSSIIQEDPKQIQEIMIQPNQQLNNPMVRAQPDSSGNKSFESVLPFIHEDGMLRDKKTKKIKQEPKQSNLAIVHLRSQNELMIESKKKIEKENKVDIAIGNQEQILFTDGKQQQKVEGKQLEELLDMSEIKEENAIRAGKAEKVSFEVQVEDLQLGPIIVPTDSIMHTIHKDEQNIASKVASSNPPKSPLKPPKIPLQKNPSQPQTPVFPGIWAPPLPLPISTKQKSTIKQSHLGFTSQQMDQKIQPLKENKPIVHAPRVFKSSTGLKIDQDLHQDQQFDDKIHKREEQLLKIREELQRNNNRKQHQQERSRSRNRNKSKQSIKGQIDDAIVSKQGRSEKMQVLAVPEKSDAIVNRSVQPSYKEQSNEVLSRNIPYAGRSKTNVRSQSQRNPSFYGPSEISKRTEQLNANPQKSTSSQSNIFDHPAQVESFQQQEFIIPTNLENQKTISKWQSGAQQQTKLLSNKGQSEAVKKDASEESVQVEEDNYLIHVNQQQNLQKDQSENDHISYQPSKKIQNIQMEGNNQEENESNDQRDYSSHSQENVVLEQSKPSRNKRQDEIGNSKSSRQHSHVKQQLDIGKEESRFINSRSQYLEQQIAKSVRQQPKLTPHLLPQLQQQIRLPEQSVSQQRISIQHDYQVEERDEKYEESEQENANIEEQSQYKQASPQLFRVQYADEDLDAQAQERSSRKEFTVQNVNQNYQEVDTSKQSHQNSIELRKTSKRIPGGNRNMQQEPQEQYVNVIQQKFYKQIDPQDDSDHNALQNIKRTQNRLIIQQQQPVRQSQANKDQVIDLLKHINAKNRNRKALPKEEKDERILIKLDKTSAPKIKETHENTNLVRKSMEKNKPINQFKFEQRNEEYDHDQEEQRNYRQPIIAKNRTNANLVKPSSIIEHGSSLRQSKTTAQIEKQKSQIPKASQPRPIKVQEVRQFDFGDQFSSERSKNQPQLNLQKWKQQFVQEGSYSNLSPSYDRNNIPERPRISQLQEYDSGDDGLEVIEERKVSRRKSKRSRQKSRNQSKGRKDELHKIYGK